MNNLTDKPRCNWPGTNPLMLQYHDEEWGVPVHDDHKHFEFLLLDTFQAGLSWSIILNKRAHFKQAFDQFDYRKIARYNDEKINELLHNKLIIRNKLKIRASIQNANSFIKIQKDFGSFDQFIWQFTQFKTIINQWYKPADIPVSTPESDAMSQKLKQYGFSFVGTTTCYAYMQAAGMVNDHLATCYRYHQL